MKPRFWRGSSGVSLRRALIERLVVAMTLIGLAGAGAAYVLVDRYANMAYDRALADDISTLASQLQWRHGHVQVDLPPVAREWLLANEGERMLYRVLDLRDGTVLDANGDLGPPERAAMSPETTSFRTVRIAGTDFRLGTLEHRLPEAGVPVLVQIGETLGQRRRIVGDILIGSLMIFALMISAAVGMVWTGTRGALRPLALLEAQAAQRSSTDLRPLDPQLAPVEVRGLIEAFNLLLERLLQSVQSQSRFIANAAHQLRTPLAGLRLQAQLGVDESVDAAAQARLREIDRSAASAAHLVEQLLTLAKAESGTALAFGRRVDLVVVARDVIERLLPTASACGVDLGYQGDAASAVVLGNAVLIGEMLANLADNALRHGRQGGVVTVGVIVGATAIEVRVSDDGAGLPAAVAADLFVRFNRADDLPRIGAGLGLAIVHEIAGQHGAQVVHRRVQPHGTEMAVLFPVPAI